MLNYEHQLIGFALNLITIGEIIVACLLSLIIIIIIIYNFICNRVKRQDKTILVLCLSIYLSSLIYMAIFFVLNILTIIGDLYRKEFDSPWCILMGYIYASILCVLYISFVNQALFRLCRIVYSQYKYLQDLWLYIIIFPIEVIIAFILSCPIYILNDIIYLPNYHFCFVPISNIRGYLWIFFTVYGIPVLSISVIYWRITVFIRKQSNQRLNIKRRQTRDLKAIRGILIIVAFMILFGLPTSFLIIMMLITGEEHPLTFRITCISIGTSMVGLSIAMMFFVPQVKNMVWKTFKSEREVVVDSVQTSSMQTRSISSTR